MITDQHARIVSDPGIMLGKPTVRGTRITVELILEELADGMGVDEILEAHPGLTEDDVRAALRFAAGHLRPDPAEAGEPAAA